MKKHLLSICVAIVLLTSCNENDVLILPLSEDLFTEIRVYDLDNNGNASDIRVDFEVLDNINVIEYRILVIPANINNDPFEANLLAIPKSNYVEVNSKDSINEYTINRLPASLLDINGDAIINEVEYIVLILAVGTGNTHLSFCCRRITLKEQDIYNVVYQGDYILNIQLLDGLHLDTTFILQTRTMISFQNGRYFGNAASPNMGSDLGTFSFIITDKTISDFIWNQNIDCNYLDPESCSNIMPPDIVDPCPGVFTGQGTIEDEIRFIIEFTGEDCNGIHNDTWILTMQNY